MGRDQCTHVARSTRPRRMELRSVSCMRLVYDEYNVNTSTPMYETCAAAGPGALLLKRTRSQDRATQGISCGRVQVTEARRSGAFKL